MNQTQTTRDTVTPFPTLMGMRPKGSLRLPFGALTVDITGGPFRYSEYLLDDTVLTVKLAKEIDLPCDVSVPTPDFSTPPRDKVEFAMQRVIAHAAAGGRSYAGCMAGQGRTGLFLALLVKASSDYARAYGGVDVLADGIDPVLYVRAHYYHHAVETSQQYAYVLEFDTAGVLDTARQLQPRPARPVGVFASLRALASAVVAAGRALLSGRIG